MFNNLKYQYFCKKISWLNWFVTALKSQHCSLEFDPSFRFELDDNINFYSFRCVKTYEIYHLPSTRSYNQSVQLNEDKWWINIARKQHVPFHSFTYNSNITKGEKQDHISYFYRIVKTLASSYTIPLPFREN